MRRLAGAMLLSAVGLVAPSSHAEPACGARGRPWLELHADATMSEELRRATWQQLSADLAEKQLDVCSARSPGAPAPIAIVTIAAKGDAVGIDVEVSDAVTHKRLAREVDLGSVPADGRGLAVAITASELLRASWAELALRTAPPPKEPPPPEVVAIVHEELPSPSPASPPRVELAALAAGELATGGARALGIDARLRFDVLPHLGFGGRVGLRELPRTSAPHGDVTGSALVVSGSALVPLRGSSSWDVAPALRVDATRVSFVGESTSARSSSGSAVALDVTAGILGYVTLGTSLRLSAEALAGPVLAPVRATDAGATVAAMSGLLVAGAVGLGGAF